MKKAIAMWVLGATAMLGQTIDLSAWDKLAAKAKESSVVTLTPETLGLATSVLPSDKADAKQLKDVVSKLKGVIIRSYEFAEKGAYSKTDVDTVRKQLGGPGWSKFMDIKDGDESVEMWFHKGEGQVGGLVILAAEPRELTFVHIDGPPDLASLMRASKMLKGGGLENLMNDSGNRNTNRRSGSKNDDEDDEN